MKGKCVALLFELSGHIATITLNRPEAMNSIDPETRAELADACARIERDPDIRVAILTGAGERAFCTGADLKKTLPPAESFAQLAFGDNAEASMARFGISKPMIAAINGYCVGGGLELALTCDILIASETARFSLPEARIGSIPGAGGTQRLPKRVGWSDAMLLLLTGDQIDAPEALRMGVVSKVVPAAELLEAAATIATRIAANAPLSVRAIKHLARMGQDMSIDQGIDAEYYVWGTLRDTEDRIEGRVAFAEKRAPVFRGR